VTSSHIIKRVVSLTVCKWSNNDAEAKCFFSRKNGVHSVTGGDRRRVQFWPHRSVIHRSRISNRLNIFIVIYFHHIRCCRRYIRSPASPRIGQTKRLLVFWDFNVSKNNLATRLGFLTYDNAVFASLPKLKIRGSHRIISVQISAPRTIILDKLFLLRRYRTPTVNKRARSTRLYHSRQCGIVLKQRSDRIDCTVVCIMTRDCSRKLCVV